MSIDISNLPKPSGIREARDWKVINEKLVQRGEIDYYINFLVSWDEELLAMNRKKVGNYQTPLIERKIYFLRTTRSINSSKGQ